MTIRIGRARYCLPLGMLILGLASLVTGVIFSLHHRNPTSVFVPQVQAAATPKHTRAELSPPPVVDFGALLEPLLRAGENSSKPTPIAVAPFPEGNRSEGEAPGAVSPAPGDQRPNSESEMPRTGPSADPLPEPPIPRADAGGAAAMPKPEACGGDFGTAVTFARNPAEAVNVAKRDKKLTFFLHVSGNFEDAGFT